MKSGGLAWVCLAGLPLVSGCLTPALWKACQQQPAAAREAEAPPPERLQRAVRTASGDVHVETLFADGVVRHHAWQPGLGPLLRPQEGPLPPGEELLVWQPGLQEPPAPDRPRIRLRGRQLELDPGPGGFDLLARYPTRLPAQHAPPPQGSATRTLLTGMALGVGTPVTVALDVTGGVVVVALYPLLWPISLIWSS